jgi:sarcosine oxidase
VVQTYDVIVAGVGGMGAAACYHLARRGSRVLGLERFDIPNDRGSSHGLTRIIRLAYFENPSYVPLARRALELWQEAGKAYGEPLYFPTGGIDAALEDNAVFQGSLESCRLYNLPHEVLTAREANRRFPGYRLPRTHSVVFQPDGGFIACDRAVLAHATLARKEGADLRANERIVEWQPIAGGGVRVRTDRGSYEAGRLILSAGAWMGELLPRLKDIAVPERQVLGWFQPEDSSLFQPDVFPIIILIVDEGFFYATPVWGTPGLKIGLYHHRGERGPADSLSRETGPADEAALRVAAERYFTGSGGPLLAAKTCMFTNTPDGDFIIDTLPGENDVIVASPCSGHGFKFASAIGEILADLARDGQTSADISRFSLARFAAEAAAE